MDIWYIILLFLVFLFVTFIWSKNQDDVAIKMIWLSSFFNLVGGVTNLWYVTIFGLFFAIYALVCWAKGV